MEPFRMIVPCEHHQHENVSMSATTYEILRVRVHVPEPSTIIRCSVDGSPMQSVGQRAPSSGNVLVTHPFNSSSREVLLPKGAFPTMACCVDDGDIFLHTKSILLREVFSFSFTGQDFCMYLQTLLHTASTVYCRQKICTVIDDSHKATTHKSQKGGE